MISTRLKLKIKYYPFSIWRLNILFLISIFKLIWNLFDIVSVDLLTVIIMLVVSDFDLNLKQFETVATY